MDFWFVLIILYTEILIHFVCKTISIGFEIPVQILVICFISSVSTL